MSTGLFPSRQGKGGPRPGYRPKNLRRAANGNTLAQNKRAMAEALADGASTIADASRQIGVTAITGAAIFRAIRADLGWQAV